MWFTWHGEGEHRRSQVRSIPHQWRSTDPLFEPVANSAIVVMNDHSTPPLLPYVSFLSSTPIFFYFPLVVFLLSALQFQVIVMPCHS